MVKHGFSQELNKDYTLILKAWPFDEMLREMQALEIKKFGGKSLIEFGCGSGEATVQIIKHNPKLEILAADVDPNVIKNAKKFEKKNVKFEAIDAFKFKAKKKYDVVTSSHFIHNFVHKKQFELLKMNYALLNKGGLFITVEKVMPDDPVLREKYWHKLLERLKIYDKYGRADLRKAMLEHETIDRSDDSIILETPFVEMLKKVGFKDIQLVIRKENDIVLTARK